MITIIKILQDFLVTSDCIKALINRDVHLRLKIVLVDEFVTIYFMLYYPQHKTSDKILEIISDFKEKMQPLNEIKKCVEMIKSVLIVKFFLFLIL